jgi:hypothetical protein
VEASNSCARTLIFGSFLLLSFVKFFSRPFSFFDLVFYCLFYFFDLDFYRLLFFLFFFTLVLSLFFLAHVVSSLAYPIYLGIKGLVFVVEKNLISFPYMLDPK